MRAAPAEGKNGDEKSQGIAMKLTRYLIVGFACWLGSTGQLAAQNPQRLNRDRLAKDLANARFLAQIPEIGVDSLTSIRAALGPPDSIQETGFDQTALHFTGDLPGGYTRIGLTVSAFRDQVLRYRVEVNGRFDSWWMIRQQMIDAWKSNTKFDVTESDSGIYYEQEFPGVATAYQANEVAQFGEFKDLPVPAEMIDAYRLLSSATKAVVVGEECGYAGSPPEGKTAIDALVNAGRLDLVENLISGPNLGGRVYAALALLRLERGGTTLSEQTKTRINKIRNSKIIIETCVGCLGLSQPIAEIFVHAEKYDQAP
jgi:hypothetical protein